MSCLDISDIDNAVFSVVEAVGDKATPAVVARWLFRESHTVSELLNRMEKEGLIKKIKDLDRKNQVRVALTKKGQGLYRQATKLEFVGKVMSSLSVEERKQLKSLLLTLRDKALEELAINKPIPFPYP